MADEFQWLTGVLRLGRGYRQHGDPYEFSCTVLRRGDEAELLGACGRLPISLMRRMKEVFVAEGVRRLVWERRNGQVRRVVWNLTRDPGFTVSIARDDPRLKVVESGLLPVETPQAEEAA